MKKIGIVFFSPTGSCKKIADEITKVFINYTVDKLDITACKSREHLIAFKEYHFVFFIFPVYAGDIPSLLKAYFRELQGYGVSAALIALWGNVHSSNALYNAQQILSKRDFSVVSGAEIVAAHSYNTEDLQLAAGRPNEKDILEVQKFALQSINLKYNNILFPKVKIEWLARLPQRSIPRIVIKMYLDEQLCRKCGLCQKQCPAGAIRDNYHINNNTCIRCLACIHVCPYAARSRTFKFKIAEQHLGRFRNINNNSTFYIHSGN